MHIRFRGFGFRGFRFQILGVLVSKVEVEGLRLSLQVCGLCHESTRSSGCQRMKIQERSFSFRSHVSGPVFGV